MTISIVGMRDYIKDGVIKGVMVHGIQTGDIPNGYGNAIFKEYFSGLDSSELLLGDRYEVEFEYYDTQKGLMARAVGLRKED